jgi:hypothetical protein
MQQFSQLNKGRSYEDVISELHERICVLEAYLDWDRALRAEHPALQDLFEKFQETKVLVAE